MMNMPMTSVIEAGMAESFAGTRLMINQLITELLAGAPIDEAMVSKYTALASTEIRQASRLGLRPRQKLIGPTLGEILAEGHARQQRGRE